MIKIIIDGKPMGKERPRVTRMGTFTAPKTASYESYVQYMFNLQNRGAEMLQGALKATVIAYYPIAKSTSKKNKALMLEGKIRPTVKPDLDNIIKIITDSLNQIAYHDDSAIVEVAATKFYSEKPRVEVIIEQL